MADVLENLTEEVFGEDIIIKPERRYFYAELDAEGKCKGIIDVAIAPEKMESCFVQIDSYNPAYIRQKYVNGVWVNNAEVVKEKTNTTQLDRIEQLVSKTHEEIAQEAIDAYTLELIEGGVI